jgi:lipopolysaccharide export system permease protein
VKKLHLLVIKSFIGPLVITFFIVIFVLLMQFLWKYIDDLVGKGLQFDVISELILYTSASLVPLALPLAILLSSIMTFGNLGENYELTAMKASGISLLKIMRPLIVLNFVIVVSAFFFSNNVLPVANLKMRSLLYDIQQQRPELQIREGIFYNGIDGYSIKIGRKDFRTNMLYNVLIYDHTQRRGNTRVSVADSGYMVITEDKNFLLTTLYSGYNYEEVEPERKRRPTKTYPHRRERFEQQEVVLELSGFGLSRTDEDLFRSHYSMMNLKQLNHSIDSSQQVIQKQAEQTAKSLINTILLNREPETFPEELEIDFKLQKKPYTFDLEDFFGNLNEGEKKNILDRAVTSARNGKNLVMSASGNHEWQVKRLRRYEMAWHEKLTLSVACFIFFFIGAPLGAIIRRGGFGMPVVVSVLFFIFYYVLSITVQKMVREDIWPALLGMWFASAVLMPMGIYLTYKAATDSVIFNLETYSGFFKKFFKFFNESVEETN